MITLRWMECSLSAVSLLVFPEFIEFNWNSLEQLHLFFFLIFFFLFPVKRWPVIRRRSARALRGVDFLDVIEYIYCRLVHTVHCSTLLLPSKSRLSHSFDSFLITEVAESGIPAAHFYYTWTLKCCRLGERKWKVKRRREEGKYWSRLSKLSATFKLLWTTAGILPASDGFNSLLHCSPQPLFLLFSSFLTSKMDFMCVYAP